MQHYKPVPKYSFGRSQKAPRERQPIPGPADYENNWYLLHSFKKSPSIAFVEGDLHKSMIEKTNSRSLSKISKVSNSQVGSKSTIFDKPKFITPGPGQYQTEAYINSMKRKVARFSTTRREVSSVSTKTNLPGPCSYEIDKSSFTGKGIARLPDLALLRRPIKAKKEEATLDSQPGVGQYHIDYDHLYPHAYCARMPTSPKEDRTFKHRKTPGVGDYNIDYVKKHSYVVSFSKYQHPEKASDTPGVGQYNIPASFPELPAPRRARRNPFAQKRVATEMHG